MRWKCEENAGETVKQENKLCDEVEMVRIVGDRVIAGRWFEAAVTVGADMNGLILGKSCELLYG